MILDSLSKLANGQTCGTSATVFTTYCYDSGSNTPKNNVGKGEPLALVFSMNSAATVSGDGFYFKVVQDSIADVGSASSHVITSSRNIAGALLTAGTFVIVPVPPQVTALRYLAGSVTAGSGDSVTFDCDVVPMSMIQTYSSYAKGFVIDA